MTSPTTDKLKPPKVRGAKGLALTRDAWEQLGRSIYDEEANKIPNTDELLRDFYLMWTFDPACGAVATIIQRMILGHLGDYVNDDEGLQEWVREKLDNIEGGRSRMFQGLLSAPFVGVAVLEKEWRQGPEWELARLDLLHPLTFAPTLYGHTWGMGQIKAGAGIVLDPKTKRVEQVVQYPRDINEKPVILPIDQVVYWPFERRFREETYGYSLLKRARRAWFVKTNVEMWWNIYMEKYATGTPIIKVPPGYWEDPDSGETIPNVDFVKDDLLDSLTIGKGLVYEGQAGGEPGLDEIVTDMLEAGSRASSDSYEAACAYWQSQTFIALLFPELLLKEPEHGSRAQAETMLFTFLMILEAIRDELDDILINQIIKPMIYWNYGPQENYGRWEWEGLTEDDKSELAQIFSLVINAWSRLVQMGIQPDPADWKIWREAFPSIFAPASEVAPPETDGVQPTPTEEAMLAEAAKVQRYAV